ncbi:hypothetical protein AX15_007535 [Amanita polypyramis BW_CC]|nr:hypothetical protein AX15_007535 [Amanita polypyramis BW_CC]
MEPDNNPRPTKRQRLDLIPDMDKDAYNTESINPIPPSSLLLALPSLLIHPPTHPHHKLSLDLSSTALQKCLSLPDIEGDLECRALTALAEVGIIQGMQEPGTAINIEKAIAKALLLAQKHPSLRLYKPHLSLLSARIAYYHQNNTKHAAQIVRRLLNTLLPSDPPHIVYTAHLALISYSETESCTKVFDLIQKFRTLATNNGHGNIELLAQVIRLRVLLREELWPLVGTSLKDAEEASHMNFEAVDAVSSQATEEAEAVMALRLHLLIMGVVYYTYTGDIENSSSRLTRLHELLDKGALKKLGPSGTVEFPLQGEKPLHVQMTHPRVLYLLAFLVSSASKRNPVGRKVKRKVFATEGLAIVERELRKEMALPQWASVHDAENAYAALHNLKADLLSELVANAICRSEFDDAERYLNTLIAHTRSTSLFPTFAARITLHHAHLSHSLGQTERAIDCYKVAAHLSRPRTEDSDDEYEESCMRTPRKRTRSPRKKSLLKRLSFSPSKRKNGSPSRKHSTRQSDKCTKDEDEEYPEDIWVHVSARVGEIWLRTGITRRRVKDGDHDARLAEEELVELTADGEALARECEGLGGTLRTIGEVLRACLSNEILKSKVHLKTALEMASACRDNHLRALIVALISSHYFHTARDHAENMLLTCEQLTAGMGVQPHSSIGRLPLSTSDKVNRDENMEQVTPKPRSKRNASELEAEENCVSSSRPLKKDKLDSGDSRSIGGDIIGNVQLRLWVGERFLELSRWAGNENKVEIQEATVQKLQEAVRSIEKRAKV